MTVGGHKIAVRAHDIFVYLAEIHAERKTDVIRSDVFGEHADALSYVNDEGEAGGYAEVIAYDITNPKEPVRQRAVYRTEYPDNYLRTV
ncbi:hypothetical protein DQ384_35125 [Sphaerisporangium album]|uniref:Uncharacterized protein n=1 Tax=Sphaerisporangium album TaxID=509200 RepID=A0A367EXH2_9ACTN|nr:hypothetical protein DQ384_35125 [Sphaerisporangium album]